ncbi:MAG: hypothetical protein PHS46_08025 [Candidatus Omnitrophica bacterium]|nr:hypothetical protein [Candidatus Omnitrophota bacterium]
MKGKCIHFDGIVTLEMVPVGSYKGYEFFKLKKDRDVYATKYLLHDEHFFPVMSVHDDKFMDEMKRYIDGNFPEMRQALMEAKEKTLTGPRPIMGMADYLGRREETLQHIAQLHEDWKRQDEERLAKAEAKKKEDEKQARKALRNAEKTFSRGDKISGDAFVSLCDKYGVVLPLRTRGWCMRSLITISPDSYKGYGRSNAVFRYAGKLKDAIENKIAA